MDAAPAPRCSTTEPKTPPRSAAASASVEPRSRSTHSKVELSRTRRIDAGREERSHAKRPRNTPHNPFSVHPACGAIKLYKPG